MSSSSLTKLSKKNPKNTSLAWDIGENKKLLTFAHKSNKDTPKMHSRILTTTSH